MILHPYHDTIVSGKRPDGCGKKEKKMKKLLSVLLCLCLLGCMPAFAEEEADADSFLLKIWDESGLPG